MGKGRGKIENEYIDSNKQRIICFKKRRISLIKRAMQLSLLANCEITLSIYNQEDKSLMEYMSSETQLKNRLT